MSESFQMQAVGHVHSREAEGVFSVVILPQYREALKQLAGFGHVQVLWWGHEHDNPTDRAVLASAPPYAPGTLTGVFASRSDYRPNPIFLTTCQVLGVDETSGEVRVLWIDAHDGTPVVDLKPYIPMSDRVKDVTVPDGLADWPEWIPSPGDTLPDWLFDEA